MRRVAAIAGGLSKTFGLAPGDRVALVMRNCAAFVESLFACWHGGWVAVPVNAKLHPREIGFILAHSGARVCFASGDLAHEIAALRPELPELRAVVAVGDADYAKLAGAEPAAIAARAPEDTAWLFYTSGTTGRPKGAMLSHRNLLAMATSYFVDVDHIAEDDCIIHAAPMSHGSGMYILPHVAAAAKQVIPASGAFEPDEVFALIEAHPGASLFAAPTMVRRLVDSPAAAKRRYPQPEDDRLRRRADVRRGLQAGDGGSRQQARADLRPGREPDDHHRVEQGAPRRDRAPAIRAAARVGGHGAHRRRGRPSPMPTTGCFLRASSARCWCAAMSVMSGYWQDPEASARTLRGGWLHTGDVGVFDADGFLTLKDRSQGPDHQRRQQHLSARGRGSAAAPPGVAEVAVVGEAGSRLGRDRRRVRRRGGGRSGRAVRRSTRCASITSPASNDRNATSSSTPCRRTTTARC